MKSLGDYCYRCSRRANKIHTKRKGRWHHCPRCGITFDSSSPIFGLSLEELRDRMPGKTLAERFKHK